MKIKTLLKSNIKSHRGTAFGVFVLILLVSLSLGTVLTVWNNSSWYVDSEMNRLGYGDITAWVSGLQDAAPLAEEISSLDEVDSVGVQSLIFSEYEIGDQESDSEGQLIIYNPAHYPYKFFADDLSGYQIAPTEITPGEVYVSASMVSMFGVQIGDIITFPIARSGKNVAMRLIDTNIRCNTVAPGATVTPAHLANKAGEQPGGAEMLKYSGHFVYFPGPECDPMDQAYACLYLASKMGRHVKGQVLQVCNGAFL